jgi:hypothetical protein
MRWALLVVALASCATERPAAGPTPTPRGTATSTMLPPTPIPDPVAPIDVGSLPQEGVAVDLGRTVVLVDLDGHLLARIPGSSLYYDWTVPGEVVLRQADTFLVLRADRGAFEPLPSREAAADLDPQFQPDVGLPRPPGAIEGSGRWAYALPGPNGLVLAQWSGECEVPVAMFVAPGGQPVGVTGERHLSQVPESRALGWDHRGRAIVDLREGVCGTTFERPGIYAFIGPGAGELVFGDPHLDGARMWGAPA